MFNKYQLDLDKNIFNQLYISTKFENLSNSRKGANLFITHNKTNIVPIVRTTTIYKYPIQYSNDIHLNICNQINNVTNNNYKFNNALIEIYNNQYSTMKFHSDQALDLEENSYICLFSCYKNIHNCSRKLVVKNKETNNSFDVILDNNSIVIFSTNDNKNYIHKIVLNDDLELDDNNEWLGITFRLSKTFVDYNYIQPMILTNNIKHILTLANENDKNKFITFTPLHI